MDGGSLGIIGGKSWIRAWAWLDGVLKIDPRCRSGDVKSFHLIRATSYERLDGALHSRRATSARGEGCRRSVSIHQSRTVEHSLDLSPGPLAGRVGGLQN